MDRLLGSLAFNTFFIFSASSSLLPLLLFFLSKSLLLAEELLLPDSRHVDPVGAASYSELASKATEACHPSQIYGRILHSWLYNWSLR